MLRIEGLTKRYRTGDMALKGVDLAVPAGEVIGLIGPSGAGKSTLIRCINRLVEPTSGRIFLNEREVTGLGRRELRKMRRRMGMIFQEFALVERLTVMENVLSGRLGYVPFWRSFARRFPPTDVRNAFATLDRVGLIDHVDKRADALSGGQRQRVGIARALQQEPELLLVDEPTASLDPKTSRQIMRLITEVFSGSIVYDGPSDGLTPEVLTRIYGEEDWTKAGAKDEDEDEAGMKAAKMPVAV
jgi:phosphonate transport system ATP-binding protein